MPLKSKASDKVIDFSTGNIGMATTEFAPCIITVLHTSRMELCEVGDQHSFVCAQYRHITVCKSEGHLHRYAAVMNLILLNGACCGISTWSLRVRHGL